MANQPIKKKDYEKHFSNEIKKLLDYISSELAVEIPFTSLTFDIFLIAGLEYRDSMLYKSLNTFLTSDSINSIRDAVFEMVTDKNVAPVRPNRTVDFAADLKKYFMLANDMMESLNVTTITSDMVFVAFMQSASSRNPIKKLFLSEGVDDATALELSKKAKDTMSALVSMSDNDIENIMERYAGGFDLGSGDDSGMTVIVTMSDGTIPSSAAESIVSKLAGFVNSDGSTAKKASKTHSVEYCASLNALAEKGQIDKLIGCDEEINEIAKVLGRKTYNNVILVGDPGVGKTAIVRGLAERIVEGNCPQFFKNATIWELNMNALIGGTQFRGQFESRINEVTKSLKNCKCPILFIDNIHNYTAERRSSEFDLFSGLDPLFSDKNVMVITTTTKKGYHNSFEQVPEIERKFQKIYVEESTLEKSEEIIRGIVPEFETYHGVKYTDEAIKTCISLSQRYITERRLPSSAIDILDEAGSMKKIEAMEPEAVLAYKNKIAQLEKEKDKKIREDKIGNLRDIDFEIYGLKMRIAEELAKAKPSDCTELTVDDICRAVSKHTNVPVSKLNTSEKQQLANIPIILRKSIVGQDEAIDVVSRGIKRNKIGLSQGSSKPILSCMFIGPTGCGKTLFAKTLAREIFGSDSDLVRFDMSEYSDETAVNKLIGASAGYVGYNEGGLLTEAIKNKKHCVILIDEVEKATDKIFNVFLQILDEGFLTDNTGYKVDFKNTILILTSNVGAMRAANDKPVGFEVSKDSNKREIVEKELKNRFTPEFLNRLDEIVYFNALSDDNLKEIVRLEIGKLDENLKKLGFSLTFTDDVVTAVFNKMSEEKEYGARPIIRIIRREIENKITDLILENDYTEKEFSITVDSGSILVS